jgi:hypothetical protein
MDRRTAAAHVALIHHIVMEECEIMEYLKTYGCSLGTFRGISESIRGHECQRGAKAFAACRK